MRPRQIIGLILAFGMVIGGVSAATGADPPDPEQAAVGQTPPRLGLVDGQVSFWRPGAADWVQAQVNTPLAPGDELSTGSPGDLELQIGARAFVRGWANTQLGLEYQEPDFLQVKVTAGHAALDLRALESGYTLEIDTPNAAFAIKNPGYYRLDVTGDRTAFITRGAGQATVTPRGGAAVEITPNTEGVIEGTGTSQITVHTAPPLDDWDRWNDARTEYLQSAQSARYVSPGTYGVRELDNYGTWRTEPTYGSVWVPSGVPADWVPYSTGSWVQDPSYDWTWVSAEPWGWAPFHSGRWVFLNTGWAWAPGPILARSVYAPALVAFYGGPGVSIGGPVVGWVALGWGEPCVPWWGPAGFRHHPWWGGWAGPRVVNNRVISTATVVDVHNLTAYQNSHVRNAVVVIHEDHFGHGRIRAARVAEAAVPGLHPIHTPPPVTAAPGSFVPTTRRGLRPPEDSLRRSVVATQPPSPRTGSVSRREQIGSPAEGAGPAPPPVSGPRGSDPAQVPPRPPMGQRMFERPPAARTQVAPPPRLEAPQPAGRRFAAPAPLTRQAPLLPRVEATVARPSPTATLPLVHRPEASSLPAHYGPASVLPRPEAPRTIDRDFVSPPPVARPAALQLRHEQQRSGLSPAAPPPARLLPGQQPAFRFTPNRPEVRPPQREQRPASLPPMRSQGTPQGAPRARLGA
jgi:uncharacterized protein DUF6600